MDPCNGKDLPLNIIIKRLLGYAQFRMHGHDAIRGKPIFKQWLDDGSDLHCFCGGEVDPGSGILEHGTVFMIRFGGIVGNLLNRQEEREEQPLQAPEERSLREHLNGE